MVLNIPDSGLLLESSAKTMAGLPMQAFAITLSDSVIENMIECVQNGQDIQLSLGNTPPCQAFFFDNHEVPIPSQPDSFDYDLYSSSASPTMVTKLQYPAMSIFTAPKYKPRAPKNTQPAKTAKAPVSRTIAGKTDSSTPKLAAVSDKDFSSAEDEAKSKAIENLKNSFAKKEADKRENSVKLVEGIPSKGAKGKPGKVKLLGPQTNAGARSHPGSPAFGALASPLLGPTNTSAQDRVKQLRFPIIHELAVQDLSHSNLSSKYEGTDKEFQVALGKIADFDDGLQKWTLKKMYWKELDVFQYSYAREEDRQKAIDNAIKQYDRMRLGASDPLWQKLLPKGDRNKGLCLSKLQMAIANKVSAPPKINVHKAETSSASGGDSEKDDSTNSTAKKGKGGEPMSRSNSQPKKKPQDTQAKRLLSGPKKAAPAASKASPKVSPIKPTATSKVPATKGGRVLSKEFISDSDSDDDEVPLSSSLPKSKGATAPSSKSAERPVEKVKAVEKTKESSTTKAKPGSAKPAPKEKEREKEKDTIRAQVMAKPTKPTTKRSRDAEEDDSSSSGTPLSKRIKPAAKIQVTAVNSMKQRAPSDASQNSRGTSSAISAGKSKTTSPIKSSPLASSPPTNASDLDHERPSIIRDHNRRDRDGERDRERGRDRDTIISRAGSSTASSAGGMASSGSSKKRPAEDSSPEGSIKRQRLTPEVMNKAHKFKQFYTRYEALHKEIQALENPHPDQMADLVDMHERLQKMKTEIYREVPITDY
ncbi:hypothetical protein B0H67DRAFT_549197 [Lasiosphaeris hirsuta]|uniref:E3 ubiquitin-protein ligase UBR1-like winged-helix domain-containing protein n=1 Tax=Lasiosphaeris hirsuta TaxID=260670 RepID=A0AA40BBW4_9PEZI|nr:hypothetical protein B0H67DRAFT_549197 [Lasiosphaeris hirsuta]